MELKQSPLDALHRELGARMVPFAGYDMPVQYPQGIIAEHRHTRDKAGLFDVSHMGQFLLEGPGVAATLESLIPADLESLGEHRQCYTLLTNDSGGVRDDLIVTRGSGEQFYLVVNAACKAADRAWIESHLGAGQSLRELHGQGLLALQGPAARTVLADLLPAVAGLSFLQAAECEFAGLPLYVTCSGYTGEDGFELSVPPDATVSLARRLLDHPLVEPAGLGARDSLRLEAGLCLYGHELSPDITPVEAGLRWVIAKARRPGAARAGGYPGAERIAQQLADGVSRSRVGLQVQGRRPVREGQEVLNDAGEIIGSVTSGGFGASVEAPIAMAYVARDCAAIDTQLAVDVRGKPLPVTVARMPFVQPRYHRG